MVSHTSADYNDYQLGEDVADDAINWLHEHMRFSPDRPILIIRSLTHETMANQTSEELVHRDAKSAEIAKLDCSISN